MSLVSLKCSLMHILWSHPNLVISRLQIYLWKYHHPMQLIHQLIDHQNRELVKHHFLFRAR